MTEPVPVSVLRQQSWAGVPSTPGIYWWYFPRSELEHLRVFEWCREAKLQLRHAPDGKVCLYHGMAKNLAERLAWHAAQKLSPGSLKSGFLSTFRLTLLALNDFDYFGGASQIDTFFDGLSFAWQSTGTRVEAQSLEHGELQGAYHYPLNIQKNRRPEVTAFVRHLKCVRRAYKQRFLQLSSRNQPS